MFRIIDLCLSVKTYNLIPVYDKTSTKSTYR